MVLPDNEQVGVPATAGTSGTPGGVPELTDVPRATSRT